MNYKPPMTYAKAKEITTGIPKDNILTITEAKGFVEGWDARMKYESEINGEPKEQKE
jgi:hypothetical protein